jgi:hypothetical protein
MPTPGRALDSLIFSGWVAAGCAFANAIASAAMLVAIRPGSAAVSDPAARFHYLTAHPIRWTVAWCTWIPAAVSLLLFFIMLALALNPAHRRLAWMAVALGALGLVPDVAAEIMAIVLPPRLADVYSRPDISVLDRLRLVDELARVDRFIAVLSGFIGNGLYTFAGLLLNGIAFRTPDFPRWLACAGLPVWAAGLALSASALADSARGMVVSTAVLMPAFILWTYAVAACYFWDERSLVKSPT